ncbi:methyltransferase domain-containing protein [Streptococcus danieliae]|uniref:Methyltransferase domain-containing protein n=1 Tax=Streptococcus danieliae TaxID=747656 RepID=A0A7X3KCL2_9STRE|nr:class I SAM-dependent methyltransferase [Streptococcus danieliae]MVX58718.1 methyltransferase domain-containing protein [Streptococcus danieliae]
MDQNRTKAIFKQMAAHYDSPERKQVAAVIHEELEQRLEQLAGRDLLLDYGCGTGLMSLPFAEHFSKLLLVDIAEEMLEQVRGKYQTLGLSNVTLKTVPEFQELQGQANAILVVQTLLHVAQVEELLEQLAAHLLPDGQIFLIDFLAHEEIDHPLVHPGFSQEELLSLCQQAGLKLVEFKPFYTADGLFMGKRATLFMAVLQHSN